jgi:nucleoside-diphosphate-sugar epimerase
MDEVWKRIKNTRLDFTIRNPGAPGKGNKILVTGATGFLGKRLVELLSQKGHPVRALARKLSNIEKLKELNAEVFFGDVAEVESLKPAFDGIDYVIHTAADTSGSEEDGQLSTIQGTKNIVDLCEEFKIKKLVYISSCNVYGVADYKKGQGVTEESSLERFPLKRGFYSLAKLEAEEVVRKAMGNGNTSIVCLRPGTIFGPGGEIFTPMIGFHLGEKLFAIIGPGKFVLPFVYIDNLLEAILASMENGAANGKLYNVVDQDRLTKRGYTDLLLKRLYPKAHYLYIPYKLLYLTVFVQELLLKMLGRKPFLTRYRLTSSQKNIIYDASKIRNELNWEPTISAKKGLEKILEYEMTKKGSSVYPA